MADLFISYARKDRQAVESLVSFLERLDFSVWWDHHIAGGHAFANKIEKELTAATAVIVVWSKTSVQSDWVLDEANLARESGKLIPICIDDTRPPLGFRQLQLIDFTDWSGNQDATEALQLCDSIRMIAPRDSRLPESSPGKETIAILPFENLSGQEDEQFFVDGMHEALIADLSKVRALKIISRTSTRVYANSTKSLREIGAELGANKLIEGSVARDENEVHLSVKLIDAQTDTYLWSEVFKRDMTHVLRLQREIATSIVDEVSVLLTRKEKELLDVAPVVNPAAYEAYLKGMYHWYRLTPQDLEVAFSHFETALRIDPDYAPAHAGIATAWAGYQQMGAAPTDVCAPKISTSLARALSIDPNSSQARFIEAIYLTWALWDWEPAETAFKKAIELDPNLPDTHAYYAHYLNMTGRFEESEPEILRALDLDPFNPLMRALYAVCLMFWERWDEAIAEGNRVLAVAPDHWLVYQLLRFAFINIDRPDEALKATRSLYTILGNPALVTELDAGNQTGGVVEGFRCAAECLAGQSEKRFVLPTQVVALYSMANEYEHAVDWLVRAFEVHDPDLPYLKYFARYPAAVMNDLRTQELIRKFNYPEHPRPIAIARAVQTQ